MDDTGRVAVEEQVRALVEKFRKEGFEDMEIGGVLHGAVIQLAVRLGMEKSKFMEMSDMLFSRMQALVGESKKEQN